MKKVPPLDSPSKTFKKEEDKLPFESFARFEREYFFINKNTPAKRFIKVFAGFLRGLFSKSALKRGFPAHAEHGACGPLTSPAPFGGTGAAPPLLFFPQNKKRKTQNLPLCFYMFFDQSSLPRTSSVCSAGSFSMTAFSMRRSATAQAVIRRPSASTEGVVPSSGMTFSRERM